MGKNHVNNRLKIERIGEVNYNRHGQKMEIVAYNNDCDITIRFDDGTIREHVYYSCFKNGIVRNFEVPDVYGVGISGTKRKKVNGKTTKEYSTWVNMLQRCYDPQKWVQFPHYKGCIVSEKWIHYDDFYEWCHDQDNWDKVIENPNKYHLDKDIICKGNKIYDPEFCSFVPANVNTLFVKRNEDRGELPIGVSTMKSGRYRARCSMRLIGGGYTHHNADTPEEAFLYYKYDKEMLIRKIAEIEYAKGTIVKRCYEAMLNYQVEITD